MADTPQNAIASLKHIYAAAIYSAICVANWRIRVGRR
jgi:hypothetical protein